MTTATEMLAKYLEAEASLLDGKTVSFGGRTLTSENLQEIRKGRQEWEARVKSEKPSHKKRNTLGGLTIATARFD